MKIFIYHHNDNETSCLWTPQKAIYHILRCGRHDNDVVDHGRSCFVDKPFDQPQILKDNNVTLLHHWGQVDNESRGAIMSL